MIYHNIGNRFELGENKPDLISFDIITGKRFTKSNQKLRRHWNLTKPTDDDSMINLLTSLYL